MLVSLLFWLPGETEVGFKTHTAAAAAALLLTLLSLLEPTPLPEERTLRTDSNTAGLFCIQRAKNTRLKKNSSHDHRCETFQVPSELLEMMIKTQSCDVFHTKGDFPIGKPVNC